MSGRKALQNRQRGERTDQKRNRVVVHNLECVRGTEGKSRAQLGPSGGPSRAMRTGRCSCTVLNDWEGRCVRMRRRATEGRARQRRRWLRCGPECTPSHQTTAQYQTQHRIRRGTHARFPGGGFLKKIWQAGKGLTRGVMFFATAVCLTPLDSRIRLRIRASA